MKETLGLAVHCKLETRIGIPKRGGGALRLLRSETTDRSKTLSRQRRTGERRRSVGMSEVRRKRGSAMPLSLYSQEARGRAAKVGVRQVEAHGKEGWSGYMYCTYVRKGGNVVTNAPCARTTAHSHSTQQTTSIVCLTSSVGWVGARHFSLFDG